MQDEVKVTQADRERAVQAVATEQQEHMKAKILRGDYDYTEAVKAFARHRQQAERDTFARMGWRPIDDCPMWELAIVTDGENVAKAQKAECDYGGFYWSIEPEDALEWEPTLWMPFALPPAPEAV